MESIGYIGVGAMGSSIAARLLEHDLMVFDLNPEVVSDLVSRGARSVPLHEMAATCRTIFVCLPGPPQVIDLLFGDGGLADQLPPGVVIIDNTSGTPAVDVEIVEGLRGRGIAYVDAPIAGGVRRAREGTALLMVGAEPDDFERVSGLLAEITSEVIHAGGVGTGHAAKLVNNLINACNRFAALEAVNLGVAAGMAQDVVVDVLNRGSGRNYATETTYPQLLLGETSQPQGFTIDLMLKDVRLANEMAEELGHDAPVGALAQELTKTAVERFGPKADQSQMMSEWYARPTS